MTHESVADLRERLARAERDRDDYLANLTATQERCTDLLNARRLARHLDGRPGDITAFTALAWAMAKARLKYPRGVYGVHGMHSLLGEAGEVANAINKGEGDDRVRAELLDTAVVAVRAYLGEVDTAGGLVLRGWTCPSCKVFNGEERERVDACRACGKAFGS